MCQFKLRGLSSTDPVHHILFLAPQKSSSTVCVLHLEQALRSTGVAQGLVTHAVQRRRRISCAWQARRQRVDARLHGQQRSLEPLTCSASSAVAAQRRRARQHHDASQSLH